VRRPARTLDEVLARIHAQPVADASALADIPLDELERQLAALGVDLDADVDALLELIEEGAPHGMRGGLDALSAARIESMPLPEVETRLRAEGVDVEQWLSRAQSLVRGDARRAPGEPGEAPRGAPAGAPAAAQRRPRPRRRVPRALAASVIAATVAGVALTVIHEQGVPGSGGRAAGDAAPESAPPQAAPPPGAQPARREEAPRAVPRPPPPAAQERRARHPGTGPAASAPGGDAEQRQTPRAAPSADLAPAAQATPDAAMMPDFYALTERTVVLELEPGRSLATALEPVAIPAADRAALLELLDASGAHASGTLRLELHASRVWRATLEAPAGEVQKVIRDPDGHLVRAP